METEARNPRTGEINGRLWGARARDWADLTECNSRDLYEAVFDRAGLKAGWAYCDAGCGSGLATQIAASRGARVFGLDAAANLLAIARERLPDGEFLLGDLEELPFPNATFELVTGFNSFQYAGNPGIALREAARVTKPGGRVVIVTWGEPEGMEAAALLAALRPLVPPPPPDAPGPFALSEKSVLRDFAADAGLEPLEVFDVDSPLQYVDLPTALRGLSAAGVTVKVIESSSEDAVHKAFTEVLTPFRQPDGSYRIIATFRCLIARV